MQPSIYQQNPWSNHGYPVVSAVTPANQNGSNGNLWGSSVRRAMGITQIICGIVEVGLGIVLVCLPFRSFSHDNIGWGIWNGMFAIIAGFFGIYSNRSKHMVIAYMVLSIIAAVMSAGCCISTTSITPWLHYISQKNARYNNYGSEYGVAHFAIYIVLDVTFALQMLMSILGASFTCGALYSMSNQQPQYIFQVNPQVPRQPSGPAPPYTAAATQAQPTNSFNSLEQPTTLHQIRMPENMTLYPNNAPGVTTMETNVPINK